MISILAAAAGAGLNRWRGHASPYKKYFPSLAACIVLAAPYAVYAGLETVFLLSLPVLVATVAALRTGHGQYFLARKVKSIYPEFIDDLFVRWFFGDDPRVLAYNETDAAYRVSVYGTTRLYWRCLTGLALTGLLVTLPAGLATLNPWLALSGLLKAPCYAFAHSMGWGTEGGEYMTGAALWGTLAMVVV